MLLFDNIYINNIKWFKKDKYNYNIAMLYSLIKNCNMFIVFIRNSIVIFSILVQYWTLYTSR